MAATKRFIVIDDNKLDCFIAEKIISSTGISEKILLFSRASEALQLIRAEAETGNSTRTIILVDIQMPLMNGFEFVEAFEQLPARVKENFSIFMLSSSINESDRNRIVNYPSVKHLLNKPLTGKALLLLMQDA